MDGFSAGVEAAKPAIDAFMQAFEKLGESMGLIVKNDPKKNATAWASFGATGAGIGQALSRVFEFMVVVMTKVIDVANFFAKNWETIESVVGPVLTFLKVEVQAFGDMFSSVFGFLQSIVSGFIDYVRGEFMILHGVFTGDWAEVWRGMKLMAFGVIDAIVGAVLSMVQYIVGAYDSILRLMGKTSNVGDAIKDFRTYVHNEMSKDLGVAGLTGQRAATGIATVAPGGGASPTAAPVTAPMMMPPTLMPPPMIASPALAAAGASQTQDQNWVELLGPMKDIATNTKQPPALNLYLDGDKLPVRRMSDARAFTPAPTPT